MTSIIEKRRSLHRHLAEQKSRYELLESQLGRLQALANTGTNTCMIAHEINNLLTPIGNYAALAIKHIDDKALTEKALQKTVQNCRRASQLMESIIALSNGQSQEKQNCRLRLLVKEVFAGLCRDFAKDRIEVRTDIAQDLTVWAVPVQIQQVLMNLILNARQAMLAEGGVLTVTARDTGDTIQIEVSDTGSGINAADMDKIFEPFSTTKNDKQPGGHGRGYGLGLAFCRQIIQAHDGFILADSKPCERTTFTITMPNRK